MKKIMIFSIMAFFAFQVKAQTATQNVEVGDVLTIASSSDNELNSFNLPRANFIIKKGGIADYKSILGNRVEVTEITTDKDGSQKLVLKREDGRKFFRSFPTITANLNEAMNSGELTL